MEGYSEELIEQIKDNIDIVDFIGEYVDLRRRGREYFGNCPFHNERTGSFTVTPRKQLFYCFGCKKGGDVIDFVVEYLKISKDQAIEYLANVAGIKTEKVTISKTVSYLRKSKKKKDKRKKEAEKHRVLSKSLLQDFKKIEIEKWIEEGIPQWIMDKYEIMYDSKSKRIVYPVYDNYGKFINIKGRTIFDNYKDFNPPIPKYINYYPVGDLDYFQGFSKKAKFLLKQKEIIIFESIKSVMKLDSFGQYNSVSSETSQLTEFQIRFLISCKFNSVVLGFDSEISLEDIKEKETVKLLKCFTNVYVVYDSNNLLGDKADKNSPVDKGVEIWKELYKNKIKI